ncbi:MAG TPA: SdrD B-like domain-containing protein [Tepidisphaeraceae bacterium]|nr:SdrD B-like domain-containing protein [Tepidisphaeraceae bacterium]
MQSRFLASRNPSQFEPLENRTMMSVSTGADGWTNVTPSSDSRIVYVSSSTGNDNNNGLSSSAAVKTIARAKSLMRNGVPDEMLLKRGDTWNESFGTWRTSGRSAQEMQLIGTYGSGERPVLNTGTSEGFLTAGGNPINYVAITGVHFVANGYTGSNGGYQTSGVRLIREGHDYLIQDVEIEGYKDNISIDGDGAGVSNVTVRRSVITDAYNKGSVGNGHAQGLYAAGDTKNLLIEENVFDKNGYKDGVTGPTQYNHDIYVNTGATGTVVRSNIIARASLNGVLLRAGGTIQDNLFIRNPVGAIVDNTASTITGNVVVEGINNSAADMAVAFNINAVPSATVNDNVIAHDKSTGSYNMAGISINAGAKYVTAENNTVYDWRNNVVNGGTSSITIRNNALQQQDTKKPLLQNKGGYNSSFVYSGNTYSSPKSSPFQINGSDKTYSAWTSGVKESGSSWKAMSYVDANRTLGTYNATLGGSSTVEAFLAAARDQSRTNWKTSLTAEAAGDYIRAGFATDATSTTGTSPPASLPSGTVGSATISGFTFNDNNINGKYDSGETKTSGKTVFLDDNNNGVLDSGEDSAVTDSSGSFSFTGLDTGTYHVRRVFPSGYTYSTAPIDLTITSAGQTFSNIAIGSKVG